MAKADKSPADRAKSKAGAEKKRWDKEMDAADKAVREWHGQAMTALKQYVDEREAALYRGAKADTRLNYHTASVQQQMSMLYGSTPHTNVDRRFADAEDDVARVAGEMLERILNEDLEDGSDGMLRTLKHSIFDFLQVDFGAAWLRYELETEHVEAQDALTNDDGEEIGEAVEEHDEVSSEEVHVDWVHWKDFRWSAGARVWEEVRWVGRKADMSREQLQERFGDIGKEIPLDAGKKNKDQSSFEQYNKDPRERAEIWEIWDKDRREVIWYSRAWPTLLDKKADPLDLEESSDFLPCPRPMCWNTTNESFMPVPDHKLCADLYKEINTISTRITLLEQAIAVRGVYNGPSEGVKRLLSDAGKNELVPVDNWALHAEKGGIKGQIDWLPLDMIVNALQVLRDYRTEIKSILYELNGQNDIVRGEQLEANTTATDARRASRYASARMQSRADEIARFATDVRRIKAEIVCKHFEPERIVQLSNVMETDDAKAVDENGQPLVPQAVELLKSGLSKFRIEIRPESLSQQDFAAEKSEAMEVLEAIGGFFQQMGPAVRLAPALAPTALKLLKWSLSRLRGSRGAEAIIDPAIAEFEKQQEMQAAQPQQQQQDPKLAVVQAKALADSQKHQQDLQKMQVKAQVDIATEAQKQQTQTQQNLAEEAGRLKLKQQAAAETDMRKAALGGMGGPGGAV